jgi:hypothetical protein
MGRDSRGAEACDKTSTRRRWCGSGSSGITWADGDDETEGDDDDDE